MNAAVDSFHQVVVEIVRCLFFFSRPDDVFGSKIKALVGKGGWWVRLLPNDDIKNLEMLLLQTGGDIEDIVVCSADPYCAVGFENSATRGYPLGVEVVDLFYWSNFVPVAVGVGKIILAVSRTPCRI